ncbi:MAG: WG repeat-containing protein [Chitinophagales bacterium]
MIARIYFDKENSARNIDSANKYILKSTAVSTLLRKTSELRKMQAIELMDFTVNELSRRINDEAYTDASELNTSEAWNHFITTFISSGRLKEAVEKRNLSAFNEALSKNIYTSFEELIKANPYALEVHDSRALYEKYVYNRETQDSTWQSYMKFIERHPSSPYLTRAQENYEKLLFQNKTIDHSLLSYSEFIKSYPLSPFKSVAEDSIYAIYTTDQKSGSYRSFITAYPANRNIENAWEMIYEKETSFFSAKTFRDFKSRYPDYPHLSKIEKQLWLSSRQLEKFKKNELYGFVDLATRDTLIAARFTEAAPFNEGMSVVRLPCEKGNSNCPYAYVSMDGSVISNCAWSKASDFTEGHAIAAIGNCNKDSCKYGFINRFGKWIVPPIYDDAYEFSEGLSLVHDKHLGYGYIDIDGKVIIPPSFTDAGTFSEGLAGIQNGDSALYGFIDIFGNMQIAPTFKKAGAFREGLAPVADKDNMWGFIDHNGNWVIKPQYEFALPFIKGRARVMLMANDKKNALFAMLQNMTIDKKGKTLRE